ncbi:hypothetical protein [Nonomuraea soli]|uniref:Uncharacterized protein n=1 Tax=Nonomuraea soli TaxID=1032476 RepID=A0A7W0CFC8_9ACTN|nr:hypothetical protein [Nonomuraea soli]MBA2889979.1 hypothetical protein [Nonomuraea soli]
MPVRLGDCRAFGLVQGEFQARLSLFQGWNPLPRLATKVGEFLDAG